MATNASIRKSTNPKSVLVDDIATHCKCRHCHQDNQKHHPPNLRLLTLLTWKKIHICQGKKGSVYSSTLKQSTIQRMSDPQVCRILTTFKTGAAWVKWTTRHAMEVRVLTYASVMLMNIQQVIWTFTVIATPLVGTLALWTLAFASLTTLVNVCRYKKHNWLISVSTWNPMSD
jgi:hypothetical protein